MNYSNLETAICDALKADTVYFRPQKIDCIPMPESTELPLPTTGGQVLVMYEGSDYNDPNATGFGAQVEKITVQLVIQSRTRRGETGILTIISNVKRVLHGAIVNNGNHMKLKKQKYNDRQQNIWQYYIDFEFDSYAVMNFSTDGTGPLTTEINFDQTITSPPSPIV